jgi:hypothetical protein
MHHFVVIMSLFFSRLPVSCDEFGACRLSTLVLVLVIEPTKNGLLLPLSGIVHQLLGQSAGRISSRFAEAQARARVKLEWLSRTLKVIDFMASVRTCQDPPPASFS